MESNRNPWLASVFHFVFYRYHSTNRGIPSSTFVVPGSRGVMGHADEG